MVGRHFIPKEQAIITQGMSLGGVSFDPILVVKLKLGLGVNKFRIKIFADLLMVG